MMRNLDNSYSLILERLRIGRILKRMEEGSLYRLTRNERLAALTIAGISGMSAAWICYRSLMGLVFTMPISVVIYKSRIAKVQRSKEAQLLNDYVDFMYYLAGSIASGYSPAARPARQTER